MWAPLHQYIELKNPLNTVGLYSADFYLLIIYWLVYIIYIFIISLRLDVSSSPKVLVVEGCCWGRCWAVDGGDVATWRCWRWWWWLLLVVMQWCQCGGGGSGNRGARTTTNESRRLVGGGGGCRGKGRAESPQRTTTYESRRLLGGRGHPSSVWTHQRVIMTRWW